jgi:MFS family permease
MLDNQVNHSPSTSNRLFYGYIVALAAFILMVVFGGTRFAFGVFFKPVISEFGWTRAMISGAFSISWITQGLFGTLWGAATDRIGPRVVMTFCGLFMSLGYLLMSQIKDLWHLYLFYGVIIGIGSSIYVPLVSTVARWFKARRGTMTGIVVAGAGVGQLMAPPVADWLISSYNWRMAYLILGGMALVVMILAAQFLKRDPIQLEQVFCGENDRVRVGDQSQSKELTTKEALHGKLFWMLLSVFLCPAFCAWSISVHIVPYSTDLGISAASAAFILALIGGLAIVGRVFWGIVGDRIGIDKTVVIGLFLMVAALCLLLSAKDTWMLYPFASLMGFAWAVAVLMSPLTAGIFGLAAHGAIMGLVNFGYNIGAAAGPFISGYIFDISGSYQNAFLIDTMVSVLGLVLMILLTLEINKRREA